MAGQFEGKNPIIVIVSLELDDHNKFNAKICLENCQLT